MQSQRVNEEARLRQEETRRANDEASTTWCDRVATTIDEAQRDDVKRQGKEVESGEQDCKDNETEADVFD